MPEPDSIFRPIVNVRLRERDDLDSKSYKDSVLSTHLCCIDM